MRLRCICLAGFLFATFLPLQAQDLATIVGTVTDPGGAAIPNATVTVSNQAVGITRIYRSNGSGDYTAARIPLGTYTVTGEAPGFQTLNLTGITLDAGQTSRVDLALKVGSETQQVTVEENVPRVETDTAAISGVVTGSR